MIAIPAPIFIGINSSRNPEKQRPAFAGAASRRQAGCDIRWGMICQPQIKKRWAHYTRNLKSPTVKPTDIRRRTTDTLNE
jgi:hypothetical protein